MDLQRNPADNRIESWRVADENSPTSTDWERAPEIQKPDVIKWLNNRVVSSTQDLNRCKLSLGVLRVRAADWEGVTIPRDASNEDLHQSLFRDLEDQVSITPEFIAERVKVAPYLKFKDEAGNHHRLQVREWGAYLLLSKPEYNDNPDALWAASGYRRGRDLMLVVGNMTNHRKNWLIIKTFEIECDPKPSLFDDLPPEWCDE